MSDLKEALERARSGGPERHHEKSKEQGKMPVRERIAHLVDRDSFVEEALLANWDQEGFGADGVVTGMASIGGRPVALMANDPTVKAGSWGPKTVEKIIRIQEQALEHLVPMIYLVDSAGARITDQVQMFPGRRGAGRHQHDRHAAPVAEPQQPDRGADLGPDQRHDDFAWGSSVAHAAGFALAFAAPTPATSRAIASRPCHWSKSRIAARSVMSFSTGRRSATRSAAS